VKAKVLHPGDTIGIIAPSWCGPAVFPHRVERGMAWLQSRGYHVVMAPHAAGRMDYVSGTPAERAGDIHRMFADSRVKAIIAAIGGDHACHLLPLLDWDLIRANPKIFMGYSDVTVLNLAIYARTGLVTFNGPAVMTDLAEFPAPLAYTVEYLERAICSPDPVGLVRPSMAWTEESLDWGQKLDLTRPRQLQPSAGWTWLKGGAAQGRLIGGCLESMQHLRGTPYWPDMTGAILFFETSEDVPSPSWVDAVLQDYENMGTLAQVAGLLVGRPRGYTDEQKQVLDAVLLERTRRYHFPIVTGADFGHTWPQFTLPIGCMARLDATAQAFTVLEAGVSSPT
jgi:muramoyltetrapeptide carboxypeptidase LdcA involved in peptidoglycan recycling